jgi:hypothetical protein
VISSYRAYGLRCVSNVPIPGFWTEPLNFRPTDLRCWISSQEPDWVCEARTLPSRLCYRESLIEGAATSGCTLTSFGSDEFFELAYGDGARFVIDGAGTRLSAVGPPSLSVDDLATYFRGPVMGFALRRRGIIPLHAAAASIGAHAILFCGATEAGKSTTAAALALRGVPILSDDIAALREEDSRFQVEHGYTWICLWPDAVLNLFGRSDALPPLTSTWEKRYLPLGSGSFEPVRRPLSAIYLLSPRTKEPSAPRVEGISAREAVLELVQNTYMNWLLDRRQRAAELDFLSRLASNVSVRRLIPHADPARIDQLCDLIVRDSEAAVGLQTFADVASSK